MIVQVFNRPVELHGTLSAPRADFENRLVNQRTMTYDLTAGSGGTSRTITQEDPHNNDRPVGHPREWKSELHGI